MIAEIFPHLMKTINLQILEAVNRINTKTTPGQTVIKLRKANHKEKS